MLTIIGAGCGSKGGAALTLSGFCDEKAANECGATGGVAANCVVTPATCKAARIKVCMDGAAAIAQLYPTTRPFNASKAPACLNQTTTTYAKSTITPGDRAATDALCQQVFSGSKKMGESCANDYECDPGMTLICDLKLDSPVCAKKMVVAKDAFCSSPGATCPTGQYCTIPTGMTQLTCMNRKATGETCDGATAPCLETLRCAAGTAGTSTCAAKVDGAMPCLVDSDCAPAAPYCDSYAGLKCDPGFRPAVGTPECAAFGA